MKVSNYKPKLVNFLYLLFFLCLNTAFAQRKEKSVIITGRIANFDEAARQMNMKIIVFNMLSQPFQDIYEVAIDSGGYFSQHISISCAQDVQLIYDQPYSIFCLPGDSMHLQLEDRRDGEKSHLNFMSGSTAKTNKHIASFLEDQDHDSPSEIISKEDAIPNDFEHYLDEKVKGALSSDVSEAYKTDTLFKLWMLDHIRYSAVNQLLETLNTQNPTDERKQFEIYDLYDSIAPKVVSLEHAKFLESYMKFSVSYPLEEAKKVSQLFKSGKAIEGASLLKQMIISNTKGYAKEMALSRFYLDGIRGRQLELVDAVYNPKDIKLEYLQDYIKNEYEIQKRYMANQHIGDASLDSLDKKVISNVMSAIVSKYKGQVVYIDFWAPWCSPCLEQLPQAKRLQAYYKNKNVTFLYLASRCTDKSWKATIANEKILGQHVNLTDEQYKEIASTYKIVGIPHYMLVDRAGQIRLPDAPDPKNFESITNEIDNLLQE